MNRVRTVETRASWGVTAYLQEENKKQIISLDVQHPILPHENFFVLTKAACSSFLR